MSGASKPVCLDHAAVEALQRSAMVIERDLRGPKVLVLPDGRYLKLFRRRRLFGRELLWPAVIRFARNAACLARLGIPTLRVTALHCDRIRGFGAAVYDPLPGDTLRKLLAEDRAAPGLMQCLGAFIAALHDKGVYFRSLHPGNVVFNGAEPGLIDVLDLRFGSWPLNRWERRRNWRHFLRTDVDRSHLTRERLDALCAGYRSASTLSAAALQTALRDLHGS